MTFSRLQSGNAADLERIVLTALAPLPADRFATPAQMGQALARLPVPGRLAAAIPALSAALIVVVGLALTVQAVPRIG